MGGALVVASDYTQLALHALAHLPLEGPGRLDDPAYLAWCERTMPLPARAPIARDAALIAEIANRDPSDALHAMPDLHRSIRELRACAARDLSSLEEGDVAAPWLLTALRASPMAPELLRVAMALAAPAYAPFFRDVLAPQCKEGARVLAPALEQARRLHPALRAARVEMVFALGARGRAFARRVLVGVPGDFGGLDPYTPAVLALHECAVRTHGRLVPSSERYVRAEWAALADVARRIEEAPEELRDAHGRWLASLSLDALLADALRLNLVDEERAADIASDRALRADRLRRGQQA